VSSGGNAHTLYDFFTEFVVGANNLLVPRLGFVRSTDRGVSWSGLSVIANLQAVGTRDPQNLSHELRDGANLPSVASGPSGVLVAAWQDARFSGGIRDGIAFARSIDGGSTWSIPVQVNAAPAVQALLPTVTVRADGTFGVLYYDMRNNTADASTLLVDAWLTTSTDGVNWSERHVAGPFDFNRAPVAEGGLFIGDYHGLKSAGEAFIGFFAQTGADAASRTDVFASVFRSPGPPTADTAKAAYRATKAAPAPMTATWQQRLQQTARKTLAQRLTGTASPDAGNPPSPH
jgi:hypothetical protein